MDALILAGGLGTRLASVVSDRAKPVAEVSGRPFLAFMLQRLERVTGLTRAILCVGHRADSVRGFLGDRFGRLEIAYSLEERALGTGGALRRAIRAFGVGAPALALNGDTYFAAGLERLLAHHRTHRPVATIALVRVADTGRYGAVRAAGARIAAIDEKTRSGPGWINGGLYVLGKPALERLARGPEVFSLERDMLPAWIAERRLGAWRSTARFIDIGVPRDYRRAAAVLAKGPE
jgi:D-glycero-alpha-D-manno-heptose 1-phosphate guanylyltransferase